MALPVGTRFMGELVAEVSVHVNDAVMRKVHSHNHLGHNCLLRTRPSSLMAITLYAINIQAITAYRQ